ncbi:MAG: PQQ-binding-like beta-propeller repeat protein [Mycobacterium sp.]
MVGHSKPGWWFTYTCAAVAAVTLLCALGLGIWSLTGADRFEPEMVSITGRSPAAVAWTAVAVAVSLLILLAAAWTTRFLILSVAGVLVAVVVMIYFVAETGDVITTLRTVLSDSVRSAQLPTATTAWLLAAAGSVAAIFGMTPLSSGRRLVSVPLVVVLVLAAAGSAAAVWSGVRAGDDGRFVDATQAAAVPIPPVPTTFGERAFSIQIGDGSYGAQPAVSIAAAGAGFVVLDQGMLTAYDSDGNHRWHYRRTGPGEVRVRGANIYDDGRTLIAQIAGAAGAALVALDAMTGERLWMSTDHRLITATDLPRTNLWPSDNLSPVRHLIARSTQQWTVFDARTGAETWSIDAPDQCRQADDPAKTSIVDLPERVVVVVSCPIDGSEAVEAFTVDPSTGAVSGRTPLGTVQVLERRYFNVHAEPAGSDAVAFRGFGGGVALTGLFNAVTGEALDSLTYSISPSHDPARAFLTAPFAGDGDSARAVMEPDGTERCRTAAGAPESPYHDADVGWLVDEFVIPVSSPDDDTYLQAFESTTCAARHQVQQPWGGVYGIGTAPGVLLVVRSSREGGYIDGYS